MENALISVVIPVYNVEAYLRECIDSVLNQTYPHFEIILVDDGSPDGSGAICDEYAAKDNRISVIHKKNGGLSSARNVGLDKALGRYVYFLDSDDWILPDALATLVAKAEESVADIVFFDGESFYDPPTDQPIKQTYMRVHTYDPADGMALFEQLQPRREFYSAVPLHLWKREFLLEHDLRFAEGRGYEDMLFTFQAFCVANVVTQYEKALYRRRYRSNSIMTSKAKPYNLDCACFVMREIKRYAKEHGVWTIPSVQRYVARCASRIVGLYDALPPSNRKTCLGQYREAVAEIKADQAYGDRALYMRCYGKFPWFVYKCYEKTIKRLFRK